MKLVRHSMAAASLAILTLTGLPHATAYAQPASRSAPMQVPRVTAFDVRQVDRVEPGADLDFTLWGTPGAQAVLQIDGAARPLALSETSPGRYQATYTVGRRDRITPESKVTVNLRRDNRVATALLSEPLQDNWPSPLASTNPPQIESVSVSDEGRGRRARDDSVRFTLKGTPGGQASVQLEGTQPRTLVLDEVRGGEYTAIYTLAAGEMIDIEKPLTARLRVGNRSTFTTVHHAYDSVRWHERRAAWCADCGVVQSINRVEVDGEGRVLGTVAGGVLGGLVGSQIGKGDGRTAAGVVGAVGGALLGREIERRQNRRIQYDVVVRTTDGQTRTVHYDEAPSVKVGDSVRVVGDTLEPRRG